MTHNARRTTREDDDDDDEQKSGGRQWVLMLKVVRRIWRLRVAWIDDRISFILGQLSFQFDGLIIKYIY